MLEIVNVAFSQVVLDPVVMVLIFISVFMGLIFGIVPGLTATMALIMFLPMTYTMTPIQGISTLVSLYIGAMGGGLITSILLNIPGTPSSIATCFDGHPMAKKGEAGKAIGVGIVFSFLGTLIGIGFLMLVSPFLASFALRFGPYEYTALVLFALSLVIILTGNDLVKGLISAVLGTMFATVGLAPIDARPRFTFDQVALTGGLKLVAFLIGMFAITEVIKHAQNARKAEEAKIETNFQIRGFGFSLKEFTAQIVNGIRSSLIGVGIGVLPGIGGGTAAMISYTVAKNRSKHPEKFGTGVHDGIVAPEAANSANIGGNMIPLLSLGIPGDVITAVLLGGFLIHNVVPGPLIFERNPDVVYGIFLTMIIAAFVMLFLTFIGLRGFLKILKIPKNLLLPVIVTLCVVGAIGDSNFAFDVWGIVIFAFVGYFCIQMGIPQVPMILGFILGPALELHLRRSSQLFQMDRTSLLNHPIALVFLGITIAVLVINIHSNRKKARSNSESAK